MAEEIRFAKNNKPGDTEPSNFNLGITIHPKTGKKVVFFEDT